MNYYATLTALKAHLNITDTAQDAVLMRCLADASRFIDGFCQRHFFAKTETRYFPTASDVDEVWIDDVLSITALTTDSEGDWTHDGESWVENTDYILQPDNEWPKQRIAVHPEGNYALGANLARYLKITGTWGYGNGLSATPWKTTSVTATVSTDSATSVTLSASGVVEAGHTILVESEQMFVESVSTTTATVRRGVNGTTASAHNAKAVSLAEYPDDVVLSCIWNAGKAYSLAQTLGFDSKWMGTFGWRRMSAQAELEADNRQLGRYVLRSVV